MINKMNITLYEVARRNMIAFAEFFHQNETMTKEEWFKIQKKVLNEIKEEIKKHEKESNDL